MDMDTASAPAPQGIAGLDDRSAPLHAQDRHVALSAVKAFLAYASNEDLTFVALSESAKALKAPAHPGLLEVEIPNGCAEPPLRMPRPSVDETVNEGTAKNHASRMSTAAAITIKAYAVSAPVDSRRGP